MIVSSKYTNNTCKSAILLKSPFPELPTMFTIIQDSVDNNISILRHDSTGFYNLTKTVNQFREQYPNLPQKRVPDWNRLERTKTLITAVSTQFGIKEVMYELRGNTQNEHMGTYVHTALYREFLGWLNVDYSIKIYSIIDKHQQDHVEQMKLDLQRENERANRENERANRENERADQEHERANRENERADTFQATIKALFDKIDGIAESNERLEKKADNAEFNLKEMSSKMNAKLDTVVNMLQEKSIVSTMNPSDQKLHHNFVVLGHKFVKDNKHGRQLSFIAGQELHVRNTMRKKFDDRNHTWTVQVGMHYNANPIDLRNNIKSKVVCHLKKAVAKENMKRLNEASIQNDRLKKDIKKHNKLHPDDKRLFKNEKILITKLNMVDIPITCNKTTASYMENEYVSYDEFLELIKSVNEETQKSPYQSETSDTEQTADNESDDYSD